MSKRVLVVVVVVSLLLVAGQAFAQTSCSRCGQVQHATSCAAKAAPAKCGECGQVQHAVSCSVRTEVIKCGQCERVQHKVSCPIVKCEPVKCEPVCAKPACNASFQCGPCPFGIAITETASLGEGQCGYGVDGASDAFFTQLKREHDQIRSLMAAVAKCPTEENWSQLKAILVPHLAAEEKAFYPMLAMTCKGQPQAAMRMQQHLAAATMLKELDELALTDCNWLPKFTVFRDGVVRHIKEEEFSTFKVARAQFEEIPFCSLYSAYNGEQQAVMTSMSSEVK